MKREEYKDGGRDRWTKRDRESKRGIENEKWVDRGSKRRMD